MIAKASQRSMGHNRRGNWTLNSSLLLAASNCVYLEGDSIHEKPMARGGAVIDRQRGSLALPEIPTDRVSASGVKCNPN